MQVEHMKTNEVAGLLEKAKVVYSAGFFITACPAAIQACADHCAEKKKTYAVVRRICTFLVGSSTCVVLQAALLSCKRRAVRVFWASSCVLHLCFMHACTWACLGKLVPRAERRTTMQNISAPFICEVPPFKEGLKYAISKADFLFGNETEAAAFAKSEGWEVAESPNVEEIAAKISKTYDNDKNLRVVRACISHPAWRLLVW